MKKIILSIAIFFILIVFIFIVYFYWQENTINNIVPEDSLFYVHLNLNKLTKGNRQNINWLIRHLPDNTYQFYPKQAIFLNMNSRIVPLLDEMALVGLLIDNKIEPVLILKSKILIDNIPLVSGGEKAHFVVKKMTNHLFVIASSDNILEKFYFRDNNFIQKYNKKQGSYISLKQVNKLLGNKLVLTTDDYHIYLNIVPKEKKLLFSATLPTSFFSEESEFLDIIPRVKEKIVLLLPVSNKINLNILKTKFKIDLAQGNPVKKEVILPDKSTFTELLIDPSQFEFNKDKKDGGIEYLIKKGFAIVLSERNNRIFLSNDLILLKKIIKNNYFPNNISKAFYWSIDRLNFKDLIITEKGQKLNACLETK